MAPMSATRPRGAARGRQRRGPVMADVAKLAGVSHQTVSRVLNDAEHVRPETRERVCEAMRELGYQPNSVARALVTGRSWTLGVVSFDTTLYGPASTLFGIERAAHLHGYFVSIVSVTSLDRASVLRAVEQLRAQGVDGVLIITPQESGRRGRAAHARRRAGGRGRGGPGDGRAGGCRRPGRRARLPRPSTCSSSAIGRSGTSPGPPDWLEARQRIEGWRPRSRPPAPTSRRCSRGTGARGPATSSAGGWPTVRDATAIFVGQRPDGARACCGALHEAGREVPVDISVVGFDDIPEAQFFTPPLTTVRQDFNELGRQSVMLLLEEIAASERSSAHVVVPPKLMVRDSTAPPPGG